MHPILFSLGKYRLPTYTFFLVLGAFVFLYLGRQEARRLGLPREWFRNLCFSFLIALYLGSYLMYLIFHFHYYLVNPLKIFDLFKGGLVFHGGLLAGLAVTYFYANRRNLPWQACIDALAVGLPLGQAVVRIGCFLGGCCYGRPTDLPWAVIFTSPYTIGPRNIAIHPSQLYEAIVLTGIFAVVYSLRRRKSFEGQLMVIYLFLSASLRFGVEFYRSPEIRGPAFWQMPLAQLLALAIALASGFLWWWYGCRQKVAE